MSPLSCGQAIWYAEPEPREYLRRIIACRSLKVSKNDAFKNGVLLKEFFFFDMTEYFEVND